MLYRIDLGQVAQRQIGFTLEVESSALPPSADLPVSEHERVFLAPVWTPGSYLVREYSRHIGRVRAVDRNGAPRQVRKVGKNRWAVDVAGLSGPVALSWSVYAHDLTVRSSYATSDWAYWNGASVLLWPRGLEDRPAEFHVALPPGWELFAASSEVARDVPGRASFRCEDLDRAVDTPCLAGPLEGWSFELGDREHRFVTAGLAGVEPPETFRADVTAVVRATADVFGGPLPFDRYTFLTLFAGSGRGGLEHLDSSTLLAPRTTFRPRASYEDFLALVAHEYLHAWNVKRMRPQELWRFDYERENHTRLLWVAEGFTAYYDDLLVRRAGVSKPSAYLQRLSSHVRAMRSNPGREVHSLGDASFDAWILLYRPDENTRNATQNYYTNGALAALVIDSEIRRGSGGTRSLDDAVRALWSSTYGEGRGYSIGDVLRCIDQVAGRPLGEVVHSLVEAPFDPDLDRALGLYGLRLDDGDDEAPYLGVRFRNGEVSLVSVDDGTPASRSGLCPGDEFVAVDGLRVTPSTWQSVWENVARPAVPVRVLIARQGVMREIEVVPASRAAAAPRIVSIDEPAESQLAHRESWLGSRSI